MKKSWMIFFLILLILSITVSATVFQGEIVVSMPLPIPCNTANIGKIVHTQTESDGSVIEIRCTSATPPSYVMTYTPPGGTPVYVGVCPFAHGQNFPWKKVSGNVTVSANGTITVDGNVTATEWWSYDAPNPGNDSNINVTLTGGDRKWIYDTFSNQIIKVKTSHNGTWQNATLYNVTNVTDVNVSDPEPAPEDPGGLVDGIFPPLPPDSFMHAAFVNDIEQFFMRTPVPVTGIEQGEIITAEITVPLGSDIAQVENIEALVGEPFVFDINFPTEGTGGTVFHELIEGPLGMVMDPSGVMTWVPLPSQAGFHPVVVGISFYDFEPHIDEFILPVRMSMPFFSVENVEAICEPGDEEVNFEAQFSGVDVTVNPITNELVEAIRLRIDGTTDIVIPSGAILCKETGNKLKCDIDKEFQHPTADIKKAKLTQKDGIFEIEIELKAPTGIANDCLGSQPEGSVGTKDVSLTIGLHKGTESIPFEVVDEDPRTIIFE